LFASHRVVINEPGQLGSRLRPKRGAVSMESFVGTITMTYSRYHGSATRCLCNSYIAH